MILPIEPPQPSQDVTASTEPKESALPPRNGAKKRGVVVLDATLRDGGYLNDWQFHPEHADAAVRIAAEAGADVIEVGYLDDAPGLAPTASCAPDLLAHFRRIAGSALLAGMLRPGAVELRHVLEHRARYLDLVRIPVQIGDPEPGRKAARVCRELGLMVSANFTNISAYSSEALTAAVERLVGVVDIVYLADSRGAVLPHQVADMVRAVQAAGWRGPIGFHAHNNLGHAVENTRAAIEAGCTWIDGTVTALGLGGRNLRLHDTLALAGRLADTSPHRRSHEALRTSREADFGVTPPGPEALLFRMGAERNVPQDWPERLIQRFGLEEARRRLEPVPTRDWFSLDELEPWIVRESIGRSVVRMRIYESQDADHVVADRIFFSRVKPVHERHGAVFQGRHRDPVGRVIVQWLYASEEDMVRIQEQVAADPETLCNRAARVRSGLHGTPFTEFVLSPTDPGSRPGRLEQLAHAAL